MYEDAYNGRAMVDGKEFELKNYAIDFDYEHFVVEQKEKKEYHVSEKTKEQAKAFVEEQKTASTGMEEQQKG